ncbi:Cyclin-dependent protein kinase inhibitor SMR [Parasponia andersonii]|uniref:Cyclin-dependent protein kinase inhibitor SMR n=1 Tax=Parasponia andersonii TaxID=3476 RepID=A0A2P5AYZ6_PARAD|nr:Cyclin-dependent protein kinase inhibitor SMR [Parasponia andersonii]
MKKLEKEEDKLEKLKISFHHHVKGFIRDSNHDHDNQQNITGDNIDNDGFTTPTSLDNKIPVIIKCPPAPKKPRSTIVKAKRKASPQLDLSSENELLFPPTGLEDLGGEIKKKARQGGDNIVL